MFYWLSRLRSTLFFLFLVSSLPALAQTGRISGQVSDQQGAAVPGATVQVVSQDSTIKRETKTDENGMYAVPLLPAGSYRVLIQAPGFGSAASQLIALVEGQGFAFNAHLTIEAAKSEVEVSGGAETTTVELGTASISTTLSSKEVASYGLNGRNFSQLITLAPGVSNQTGQDEAKVGVAGSAKFSVNGGRVEYNTFEIDGSDVLNTSINASRGQGQPLMVYPSIDAIQDMTVLTSNYSALYGKSASGSVIVSTKSGTANFHGNAYAFLRNEMFNARNYFDQPGRTPLYRRQDYGATFGGPLFIPHIYDKDKSKTFFFFSEELRLEKTPVDYNQAVPTVAERKGDFKDVCPVQQVGGTDFYSTPPPAYADCPFAYSGVGAGGYQPQRIVTVNYASQAILNTGIIPAPNSQFGCNTTNPTGLPRCYVASVSPPTYWREELFRIDHYITSKQQLSFRYIHDAWNTTTLTPQWGIVQNSFPTVENRLDGPGLNLVASLTQTLPHGFLNRLAVTYEVEHISLAPQPGPGLTSLSRPTELDNPGDAQGWTQAPNNCGTISGPPDSFNGVQTVTGCPMGYIFQNGYGGDKMPGLVFQGTNGAYGGHGFAADTGYAPWNQSNPTYSIRDDASKTVGTHNIQFGVEATYVRQRELSAVSGANSGDLQGLLTFSNQNSIYSSGNAFVDFLAGPGLDALSVNPATGVATRNAGYANTAIKSYTQDSGQSQYDNRYKEVDLYLQDDWRVHHRLTVNVGLRANFFGDWYNPNGTAYNWRPEAYDPSLGGSIYVDPVNGYLVRKSGTGAGSAVPLNRIGPYSFSALDPAITNGLVQCGVNGLSASCMKGHPFHPSPRVGFSWDPYGDGKTAIRGGYGIFWEHGTGYEANSGSLIGSAPMVLSETQSAFPFTNGIGPGNYNFIGYTCQGGSAQCGSISGFPNGVTFPLNVTSIPTKTVYSNVQQWSFSVQRELQKNTVFQLAYVGTKGTHLTAVRDLNQLTPLSPSSNPFGPGQPIANGVCGSPGSSGPFPTSGTLSTSGISTSPTIGPTNPGYINMLVACSAITSADVVRPYPGLSNIISVDNIADSNYHALQTTLRETTGPLTIGLAYTYSHSRDDSSDRASANFANSLDIKSNYASSDFDQRHLLNISYLYDLPLLRMLQGVTNLLGSTSDEDDAAPVAMSGEIPAFWKRLIDGWQLSGITAYQSGTPFSVLNGGGSGHGQFPADNAGVGDGLGIGSYVDVIGGAHGPKPLVAANGSNIGPLLLNPNAFAAPRGLTFGNTGRNFLNNPARTNFNMSLLKHFKPFSERLDIEFRAEAYNVFNHTQFRIYDPSHPGNTGNNVANCYGDISTGYSAGASGCLVGNSFLHPVDAHDPRILQFGLKGSF
jgi:Carboxypeptidase regulatory-like domain/TonB-dependent Receptor Plug Domain